jgi:SAM-dependent methyltransferase
VRKVADFFDEQADSYHHRPGPRPMSPYHTRTARTIEAGLSGRVLCVGGVWACADLSRIPSCEVVVADVSREMLAEYSAQGLKTRLCDARRLDFPNRSFDHAVVPLVLHHITGSDVGSNGWIARREARGALADVHRILKPGGKLWISEFCVWPLIYGIELLASPATRRVLSLAGIPLVVMHSVAYYRETLRGLGFAAVSIEPVRSPEAKAFDLLRPVIGLDWLVVPRFVYPVRPYLITAERPAEAEGAAQTLPRSG